MKVFYPGEALGENNPGECKYAFLSPPFPHFLRKGHSLTMPAVGLQMGPSLHSALGSQTDKPTHTALRLLVARGHWVVEAQ